MFQKFASSLLVILLLGTLIAGQCAACPLLLPQAQDHGCCHQHDGDGCQMPAPERQPGKACPDQALAPVSDHQIQFGTAQLLPALSVAAVASALAVLPEPIVASESPLVHAPPDLYLLNSTLLV